MMAVHAESHGSGPALVLWHGWGMNLRVFDPLVAKLAPRWHITGFDLPGHGRSPWPAGAGAGDMLPSLLSRLPAGCVLLGWSLGGMLALRAAQLAPRRIRALVLLHTTPKFVSDAGWTHGVPAPVLQRFATSLLAAPERTVADFLELQVRGSRDAAAVLVLLRHALQGHGAARPAALAAGLELLRSCDLRAVVPTLQLPALVIAGEHDRVTPPAAAHALGRLLPRSRVEELPRAGHASFLSHTDAVAALCEDWLCGLPT